MPYINHSAQTSKLHPEDEEARSLHGAENLLVHSSSIEKQRLRSELLRLIVKNESLRKQSGNAGHDLGWTDGSSAAASPVEVPNA
jgi:hypothetical protein